MSALLLTRLGSGQYADGPRVMYALIDNKRVVEVIPASNDDEALVNARALAGERIVECESALEGVARRRDAPVRPLAAFEKIIKAHVAAPLFEQETYRGGIDGEAMMDFFEAAYVFTHAVAADARPQWHVGAILRGTIGEKRFDDELFFLVVPGREPKLYVLTRADATWVFANDAEITEADRTVVDFRDDRSELSATLEDAYGLTAVPHIVMVAQSVRRKPDSIAFEYLAACMGTIGRYVAAGAPGIVYAPLLGGELDIKLATFEPTTP
ncbi:hypothetical protein WMF20_45150 [Sorangium sp. So ce834]|uniref:hypothetical protein n=1 Tax=Sorangium sp. So ce834 TaxID=3133321 RepID=UPI003F5DC213